MPTDGDQSSLLEALHMLIREVWPRRHVAKYWLLIGLDPGLSFHHYLQSYTYFICILYIGFVFVFGRKRLSSLIFVSVSDRK